MTAPAVCELACASLLEVGEEGWSSSAMLPRASPLRMDLLLVSCRLGPWELPPARLLPRLTERDMLPLSLRQKRHHHVRVR